MAGPLQGIKVLDFSMGVAGPHAAMLMAQQGAEVVKIESHEGDWSRVLGRRFGDLSAFSIVYNQGKRSLAIDLKQPEAQAAVRGMALQADVLIESFRPGVMGRFGLGTEALRAANPRLVYLSISGFGASGPMADKPATDLVMQAFTGLMHGNRYDDGLPRHIDFQLIDAVTGLYAYQAIAGALFDVMRNGAPGRHIDCSLMKSALAYQAGKIAEDFLEQGVRPVYVPLGVFRTADGFVSLSTRRDDHFAVLCRAVGRPDLAESGRYATGALRVERRHELMPELEAAFRSFGTAELARRLGEVGVLSSVVNRYADMLQEEQVRHMDAVDWQQHAGMDAALPVCRPPGSGKDAERSSAPGIGQHSVEVLTAWGVDDDTVRRLAGTGAIRVQTEDSHTGAGR
jgi:crotonobetainyl-CoA:carnitine CoA-transferase CaiB-like acyl-CoA transferase